MGTCHCLQYHAHLFHTRIPGLSSPTTERFLCGGDPPRGLSDETTSLGSWVQRWKGSQLQPFKPSHLDDFCSANNCLTRRAARVWSNRENWKDFERSKHLKPFSRDCISSLFRWPCYQIQGSVNLVLPRPQEMHPSAKKGHVNRLHHFKGHQEGLSRWSCCHWIGQGMHPTPSIRSESERELLDLHFHRRPRPEFQDTVGKTCRTTNSKDKGKWPHPEENRQRDNLQITKLGDDQERRAKWQKTQGRELLASTKKTQWMRTARKVQQRKPVPPMRKNRPEQKNTKKTETASKTGANEKTYP